jgi:DNA-binding CsgD family transcriptional regulator
MSEASVTSGQVPRAADATAEALLAAGGKAVELKWIFERSHVPMVMVEAGRRYVVNGAARVAFRLGLDEMRTYAIDELTPPQLIRVIEQAWARLVETGSLAGRYQAAGFAGDRLDIAYCALAHVVPGLQLIAFGPADWAEDELGGMEDGPDRLASLTPREIEVLALAAEGLGGPEIARRLVLSPATVNTHFKNIYGKLDVRNRAAAVAKAMRLRVID